MNASNRKRLAVLISGGGTTLKNLLQIQAAGALAGEIALVISSTSKAGGLKYAADANVPVVIASKSKELSEAAYCDMVFGPCREHGIDWVVMGGFLKYVQIPSDFAGRVVNIHPSLIPSFCGKGMYGMNVHQAVIDYGCTLSGCTVHLVDDQFDHGPILAQRTVPVLPTDDAATLQKRVFREECRLFPEVLNSLVRGELVLEGRRARRVRVGVGS